MWTTFKDYQHQLKSKGFTNGFVPMNMRATNEHAHRHILIYLCNRFTNPMLLNFFREHDIEIDEEKQAVSELLQWIWRSRIRKGEPIQLFIPSSRMRNLLHKWLQYKI